jgi:hypothetical protein
MDTTGSGAYGGLGDRFKIQWKRMNPARYDLWSLGAVSSNIYRLSPASSSSSIRPSIDFPTPGETLSIAFAEIGTCLGCSGIPTWHPPYFRGKLRFYFQPSQTVIVRLYSDDLRKPSPAYQPCTDYSCDSLSVRKILDRNGMEAVAVAAVANNINGRITQLQLYYNSYASATLSKPITTIPDEIGNLTALKTIMASGNGITSISQRIGKCTSLSMILANNNGITTLPDSIVSCPSLRNISLENNKLERLPDSIGKMRALKELSITMNQLTSLPPSIVRLDSLSCIFIEKNRICALPDSVVSWLNAVRARTYCARAEPRWPDSQACGATALRDNRLRTSPNRALIQFVPAGENISVIRHGIAGGNVAITLNDALGRRIRAFTPQRAGDAGTIERLSTEGLPAGLYFIELLANGTRIGNGRMVIGR